MTTYTIALLNDMLVATAVDGDERMMANRLSAAREQGIEFEDADLVLHTGLTLFKSSDEAEEAGAAIVYSGTDMGWLEDENGQMIYEAAGRI